MSLNPAEGNKDLRVCLNENEESHNNQITNNLVNHIFRLRSFRFA